MENASKALIIAGAILLSILIIAIGMYIYNSSTNSIYSAGDQISAQDKEAFNSQWTSYEEAQPGSSVKSMISRLISNANANKAEKTKLPDLFFEPTDDYEGVGEAAAPLVTSNINNTNIKGFNSARTMIESKHTYFVELHYSADTSLVDAIYVHYSAPGDALDEARDYDLPTLGEGDVVSYDNVQAPTDGGVERLDDGDV